MERRAAPARASGSSETRAPIPLIGFGTWQLDGDDAYDASGPRLTWLPAHRHRHRVRQRGQGRRGAPGQRHRPKNMFITTKCRPGNVSREAEHSTPACRPSASTSSTCGSSTGRRTARRRRRPGGPPSRRWSRARPRHRRQQLQHRADRRAHRPHRPAPALNQIPWNRSHQPARNGRTGAAGLPRGLQPPDGSDLGHQVWPRSPPRTARRPPRSSCVARGARLRRIRGFGSAGNGSRRTSPSFDLELSQESCAGSTRSERVTTERRTADGPGALGLGWAPPAGKRIVINLLHIGSFGARKFCLTFRHASSAGNALLERPAAAGGRTAGTGRRFRWSAPSRLRARPSGVCRHLAEPAPCQRRSRTPP